jgi:hypothetical protein
MQIAFLGVLKLHIVNTFCINSFVLPRRNDDRGDVRHFRARGQKRQQLVHHNLVFRVTYLGFDEDTILGLEKE